MALSVAGGQIRLLERYAHAADSTYSNEAGAHYILLRDINRRRVMQNEKQAAEPTEDLDGITVLRHSGNTRGWNGIRYKTGLAAGNTAAKKLSMNVATVPPGGVAFAHIHVDFEVMLYILSGRVRHEYGEGLTKSVDNEAGDFIFIEPGVPHEVINLSATEPVMAVVARSDASEWEHIVDVPSRRRPA